MKNKLMIFGVIWIFCLHGCALPNNEHNVIPTLTKTTISLSSETPKPTFTMNPAPTTILTFPPTWTPTSKLSQEEANQYILDLYETNGGCEMPCWWGITPGVTSWETALEILSPIGRIDDDPLIYEGRNLYYIIIVTPENFKPFSSFGVYLDTQDQKVQHLYIADTYTKPYNDYQLSDYLDHLGKPDQVYVEIHYDLVIFSLIYVEKGLIIYNQEANNKLLKPTEFIACPQYPVTWYWSIWNPESTLKEDLLDVVVDWQNEFPLEEVSGVTPQEFYEIYLDPNTTVCMEGQGGTEP